MHRDRARQHVGMGPVQVRSADDWESGILRQAHIQDLIQLREGMEVRSGLDMAKVVEHQLDSHFFDPQCQRHPCASRDHPSGSCTPHTGCPSNQGRQGSHCRQIPYREPGAVHALSLS
jgi:hypothetical protein